MGGKSFRLLHVIIIILLHFKPAVEFNSEVGDTHIRCIERERQALLVFKQGIVDKRGLLSSWGSEDCCEWRGVHCRHLTGHVLKLDLRGYHLLQGKISPSLLELHHLNYLDLYGNDFNGSHIPKFIGSLSNLKTLYLGLANLKGLIPYQFRNLSQLEFLDLSGNHLMIVNLEFLSHLSSLKYLDLSFMNLSKAHDWLEVVTQFSMLSTLLLYSCDLPPISPLNLSHNNSSNSLTAIGLSFNHMNSLEHVNLGSNQLEGNIAKYIGNICTLRALHLPFNNLSGQLIELNHNSSGCRKHPLEILSLNENQITGSLPDFAIFTSLRRIFLPKNKLNGTVPKSIANLYKLEVLEVSSNSLEGVISEAHLSNLSNLKRLGLSHNSLALDINPNWVPSFQLEVMYLGSCKLGPNFPNWIRTQGKISFLDLSNNGILDTIPEWFWDLSLSFANLSNNQITGRLPHLLAKSSASPGMDLSSNCLEGPLPLFHPNMSTLNLSNNRFTGSISNICKITGGHLEYLDLSENLLSGELTNCFSG